MFFFLCLCDSYLYLALFFPSLYSYLCCFPCTFIFPFSFSLLVSICYFRFRVHLHLSICFSMCPFYLSFPVSLCVLRVYVIFVYLAAPPGIAR